MPSGFIIHTNRNYIPIINRNVTPFRTIQGAGRSENPIPKKYMCSICERNFIVSNKMLYPRKCLNENDNPHPICRRCWFKKKNGFANEDENHECVGCVKGLPHVYYGLTREERRKRLQELSPTDVIIDITDDYVEIPIVNNREQRKYTVIPFMDLTHLTDSDDDDDRSSSNKKQKTLGKG